MNNEILEKYDLTVGKPLPKILFFALPLFVGNLFQQLYNLIDSIIVDRTLGSMAFSAIGITGPISFLVIGLGSGMAAGFAVITSQAFGAKDVNAIKRSIATSYILCAVISVVLTVAAVLLCRPLLTLMQTPAEHIDTSYSYIITIFYGLSATVFFNITSCHLRALGDSRTPLYMLIVGCVVNIALDYTFIVWFKMGVAGAGIATVISQVVTGFGCLIVLYKKHPELKLSRADFRLDMKYVMRHIVVGLPMGFQFSIIAIGVIVQQTAVNKLGLAYITAYTAANKVDNLMTQTFLALGGAMATYCGQNTGAGRVDRIKEGVGKAMLFGIGLAIVSGTVVSIFGKQLTTAIVSGANDNEQTLSATFLTYQGVMYILLAAIFVYRNSVQGMGNSVVAMIAGATELAMRIVAAFVLVEFLGFTGICMSNPIAWIGADLVLLPSFFIIVRKMNKNKARFESVKAEGEV